MRERAGDDGQPDFEHLHAARDAAPLAASFAVWGMTATVVLADGAGLSDAVAVVRDVVAAVDAAASRFRADSELAAVNRAPGRWVPVSPLAVELVDAALRAADESGGAVDPTLGSELRALGYDRNLAPTGADQPYLRVVRVGPRWREVDLDRAGHRVRVPAGVELDLGASAKAVAADRAAGRVHRVLGGPVLVGIGGDIAVAGCGRRRTFPVRLAEDHRDTAGPVVWVGDGGIATSTTSLRRWTDLGQVRHHLLDPWTGLPAVGPVRTVTVAAADCLAANTATTATIALGHDGPRWLAATGLPARLVSAAGTADDTAAGTVAGAVRAVNGWPEAPPC
ncbi:FAD:protein FMN transferase [Actinophytocola sp.]|uniref:FAD:protein FMN transferase n=1 Tax=Actinophytocola sp. TaxID=1872138 RepID=UPI002EDA5008